MRWFKQIIASIIIFSFLVTNVSAQVLPLTNPPVILLPPLEGMSDNFNQLLQTKEMGIRLTPDKVGRPKKIGS